MLPRQRPRCYRRLIPGRARRTAVPGPFRESGLLAESPWEYDCPPEGGLGRDRWPSGSPPTPTSSSSRHTDPRLVQNPQTHTKSERHAGAGQGRRCGRVGGKQYKGLHSVRRGYQCLPAAGGRCPGARARACVSVSERGCLALSPGQRPSAQTWLGTPRPGTARLGLSPAGFTVVLENLEEPLLSVPECLTPVPQTVTGLLPPPYPPPMGQKPILVSGVWREGYRWLHLPASHLTLVYPSPLPTGLRGQCSTVGSVLYVRVHARHFVVLYVHTFRVL